MDFDTRRNGRGAQTVAVLPPRDWNELETETGTNMTVNKDLPRPVLIYDDQ